MQLDLKKFLRVFVAALKTALEDGQITKEDLPAVIQTIITEALKED